MMTSLVIALKRKMLEHREKGTVEYCHLYFGLWDHLDNYCYDTLKGDELVYFLEETDAIN
ncbi:MAG: hypothetical protein MJZ34_02615 [Paludibacteraceae bacterium]|nr:hypothetical protein [Paludibacteraceae bacterium]